MNTGSNASDVDSAGAWARRVLLLLVTLWVVGIGTRGVWTPDEPREYALSWNMQQQAGKSVPLLGDTPFLEKPPLTYWAAASSMQLFGSTPVAARLPNLLYGLVTVLCTALLTASLARPRLRVRAGALSALIVGTAWLDYLHTVWLATDAPLLAASALSWLGLWQALSATTPRARTWGYALFHLGLAAGFLAKNILGLIAPLMALVLFIVWQRRWRELRRWQLWAGSLISLGLMGPWIYAVGAHSNGGELLKIALWDNSVGRFLPVATAGEYRSGHVNSPGKLIWQVSLEMLPWLFTIIAGMWLALKQAWRGADSAAARFIIVASLPLLLLLSLSSTVRDMYALPATVTLAAAGALWAADSDLSGGFDAWCARLTRFCLIAVGSLLILLALAAPYVADGRWPTDARLWVCAVAGTALIVRNTNWLVNRTVMARGLSVYSLGLLAALLFASPVIERGQDLRPTAIKAAAAAGDRKLLVTTRDETMMAALDYATRKHARAVSDFEAAARIDPEVAALIEIDADRLTPAMRQRLSKLSATLGVSAKPASGTSEALQRSGWNTLGEFPNPGGRHYILLIPPIS